MHFFYLFRILILQYDAAVSLVQCCVFCSNLLSSRWDRLGDIVILPTTSFKSSMWDSIAEELWPIVAKSLKAHRLARQVIIYA